MPADLRDAAGDGRWGERRRLPGAREEQRARRGRRERRDGRDGPGGRDARGLRPRHRGERHDAVRPRGPVPRADHRRGDGARLVLPKVGPEALTGSTRTKAGTATKLVLNTLSTGAMIRLGRAYGNLMVDLMALSDKLRDRGERIVMECCNVDRAAARGAIEAAGGSVKLAIVMARRGVRKAEAERLLAEAGGFVRKAAGDPPLVSPS